MHTITELGTSVPAFLGKLWKLVEDPETDDLICWAPNGRSFYIRNQAQFARELLPHYYKHNNMASFVRQLNMYGFHKKVSVELGGLKCDRDEMEFAHQYFCKGHPCLLEHIKRKIASSKGQDTAQAPMKPELMTKMLSEVRSMRGRQEHLDSRLGSMKRENEALWRELAMLRQKHMKQQQIVNKLIHFLVTLVQPSRSGGGGGLSVKRRYPLMIDDPNRQRAKQSKMSNVKPNTSPTGPVIHELDPADHELEPEYIVAEILEHGASPAVHSPDTQSIPCLDDDENMETIQLVTSPIHRSENVQLMASQEGDCKKKRSSKGKKPEETLFLEVPAVPSTTDSEKRTSEVVKEKPKPVIPLATVRSSKLAAMAANMTSAKELGLEFEVDEIETAEEEERNEDDNSPIINKLEKLDEMLLIPDQIDNENYINHIANSESENNQDLHSQDTGEGTSATTSKDLSLSRFNDPIRDEVDNHLESMQTELDNLRELLRGEGYSIDANTLLGLFGADDPMSFGIPMNPELNPHSQTHRDKEGDENLEVNGGGELMAYNPPQNFLDFDNDIFLGATSSLSSPMGNAGNNDADTYESFDLEDSKASLLESLKAVNEQSTS